MGFFGVDKTTDETNVHNQQVALNAGGIGISGSNLSNVTLQDGDTEVAKKALEVSQGIANGAYETIYHSQLAMARFQDRAFESTDNAVNRAQQVALQAAPVSPGNYAEAIAGQNNKTLMIVAAIVGVSFLIIRKT